MPDLTWSGLEADAVAPLLAFAINVAEALVLLIIGFIATGWITRRVRERVIRSQRIDKTLGVFIASAVRYVLMIAIVIAVLQTFGFQVTSLVAMLGAASLAIGLALQGTLSNVAAGLMVLVFRPYRVGDFIETAGGHMGTVTDLNLFMTELTQPDGPLVFLPNAQTWGQPITNYSVNDKRRCDITFSIGRDADIDRAIDIVLGIVKADPRFISDPAEPWIRVVAIGDSSVELQLRAWCMAADMWEAKFATTRAVKEAFDSAGIAIPYPHRTIIEKQKPAAKPSSGAVRKAREPATRPASGGSSH